MGVFTDRHRVLPQRQPPTRPRGSTQGEPWAVCGVTPNQIAGNHHRVGAGPTLTWMNNTDIGWTCHRECQMRIINMLFKKRGCQHRWAVAPSAGSVSLGRCRFCHEAREFRNCQWAFAGLLPAQPSLPLSYDRAPVLVGNR